MKALSITPVLGIDTRAPLRRAGDLYASADRIRFAWVRNRAQHCAWEAQNNILSLRFVGPQFQPPSLTNWGLTLALSLLVAPRVAMRALGVFLACHTLRMEQYRAIAYGVAFALGASIALAIALLRQTWSFS